MFKQLFIVAICCAVSWTGTTSASIPSKLENNIPPWESLIGRWDLTLDMEGRTAPSWLEVSLSGSRTLVGAFVGAGGSVRPISRIDFDNGRFSCSFPPQWERGDGDFLIEGQLSGDALAGTMKTNDGKTYAFKGVRAPYLDSSKEVKWGDRIGLFNGKDLQGWKADRENQWVVKEGVLTSPRAGANLISEEKFTDFKLYVEFRCPKEGNSGVYLRGRYEVQIMDMQQEVLHPESHGFAGVYGFLTPNENAAKPAGEWQTYEITLIGRKVTIIANGKTVICEQLIPGITGGALDSNEGAPGPIYLQGDHTPIEFRKIDIVPAS